MNKFLFALIYIGGVLVSSFAQVLLKKSSQKQYNSKIKEYLNPYVIIAYSIFFIATLSTVLAYSVIPLSLGAVLAATEYIFVAVLSRLFLKEKITKKKIFGLIIIIFGVFIFSFDFSLLF